MKTASSSTQVRDCPYFGLDYYTEEWGDWFFGRDPECSRIITNLRASRLTLLHAESGVGKSSLLRAGVAWRLKRVLVEKSVRRGAARYVPVVFNSFKDDPVSQLVQGIADTLGVVLEGEPAPKLPGDRLDAAIEAAAEAANATLLIILDQFEEYFIYSARESVPRHFADELARCINSPQLPANFLIAIREDAYAGLGDLFKGRIANVYGNYLHVDYLDRQDAHDAICKPLEVYNSQPGVEPVEIEPALADAVLAQVPAQVDPTQVVGVGTGNGRTRGAVVPRIATPLLQLVMEAIWNQERAAGSRVLRLSTLEQLHGVERIVDTHLAQALAKLGEEDQQVAIDCFDHLVTPSGGKIAEAVPDLAARTSRDEETIAAVLDKLDPERIVRPVPAAPGRDPLRFRRFEIFHDVLAGAINRAIAVREEQRLAREKHEAEERARRDRLQAIRARRWARVAFVGLGVALVAAVAAIVAWRNEVSTSAATQSEQLAQRAENDLTSDPQLSLSLALQALEISPTAAAQQAVLQAYPNARVERAVRAAGPVYSVTVTPNGRYVATAGSNVAGTREVVEIWDTRGGAHDMTTLHHTCTWPNAVAFSSDGSAMVAVCDGGDAYAYRFRSGRATFERRISIGSDAKNGVALYDVAFLPNEDAFATVDRNGQLCLYGLDGMAKVPCSPVMSNPKASAGSSSDLALNTVAVAGDEIVTTSSSSPDTNCPLDGPAAPNHGCSQVMLWSVHNLSAPLRAVPVPTSESTLDASFNAQGNEIVTTTSNGTARIWNLATPVPTQIGNSLNTVGFTSAAIFTPNGNVVTGNDNGQTTVWSPTTGQQIGNLNCRCGVVYDIAYARNGGIVTGSGDALLRLWGPEPRQLERTLTMSDTGLTDATYVSPHVVAAVDNNDHVILWNTENNDHTTVPGEAVSFEAKHLGDFAAVDPNGGVEEWSIAGGRGTMSQFSDGSGVEKVAVSPDGRYLAVASGGSVFVVPYPQGYGAALVTPPGLTQGPINSLAFNQNGSEVLAAFQNGEAVMWPTKVLSSKPHSGHPRAFARCVFKVPGYSTTVLWDAEFDRSGTEVVTADNAGDATVFSTSTCQAIGPSLYAPGQLNTASFDPRDPNVIVTAGDDGSVRIWDVDKHLQVGLLLPGPLPAAANSAVFNARGTEILTGGNDGVVRFWSTREARMDISEVDQNVSRLEQLARDRITALSVQETNH